ncbi:hypothetical protein MIR68_003576 [Amoeboaphelidium protococcarum]|nr:hypothetical protein MIR68_003576 [Amoeboaphelidium protococcarum]
MSHLFTAMVWEKEGALSAIVSESMRLQNAYKKMIYITADKPNQVAAAQQQSQFQWNLKCAVYFSNYIEKSGLAFEETCSLVSQHLETLASIRTSDDSCLILADIQASSIQSEADQRRRAEVTQHVDAFLYLYDRVIVKRCLLDENLMKNAHHILMNGLISEPGQYRNVNACAGTHQFFAPDLVPQSMKNLMGEFGQKLAKLNLKNSEIDADNWLCGIHLAAEFSFKFVSIHPFVDGNGRMSRILMNIVLLSIGAPFCSALGFSCGHQSARKHYFRCILKAQSSSTFDVSQLASVILYSYVSIMRRFFSNLATVDPDLYSQCQL